MYEHTTLYLLLAFAVSYILYALYGLIADLLLWINGIGISTGFVVFGLVCFALGATFLTWAQKRIIK